IFDAERSKPWPTGEASVSVSTVHLAKGAAAAHTSGRHLDSVLVDSIDSRLRARPERPEPVQLTANAARCFVGNKVGGQGFVLTREERAALVASDIRNAERIFPYLGGEEINNDPAQCYGRYVIDFG